MEKKGGGEKRRKEKKKRREEKNINFANFAVEWEAAVVMVHSLTKSTENRQKTKGRISS